MSIIPNAAISKANAIDTSALQVNLSPLAGKAEIISGKLTNLKERLEGFDAQIISAGDRFKESAFGSAQVGNGIGTFFEQVGASGHSKNPLANAQLDNFSGGGRGHYSEDPAAAAPPAEKESFSLSTFVGSVVEGVIGLFAPRGSPTGLLTGPGTVETVTGDPADLTRGVQAIAQSGDKDPRMKAILDDMDKTPVPDSDAGGPPVITAEVLKQIAARLGSRGEPIDDGSTGKGGPVSTPKVVQQGEWAGDGPDAVVVNSVALKGIEARINANITIIR